jgi:hypothetical protein
LLAFLSKRLLLLDHLLEAVAHLIGLVFKPGYPLFVRAAGDRHRERHQGRGKHRPSDGHREERDHTLPPTWNGFIGVVGRRATGLFLVVRGHGS